MKYRKASGFFAGGLLLIGLAGASGQSWGHPAAPRSGACFYEHPNFGGRYFCAAIGDSTEMVPEKMNDKVSSIRVFGDAEVTVFKDRDFRGDLRRFERDVEDLRAVGFNDRISSFRIEGRREREGRDEGRGLEMRWGRPEIPRSGACFYEHPNFGGRYFCAEAGSATAMVPEGMNDKVSSVRLFGDAEVTVFKDRDFRGDLRRFRRNVEDLRGVGFNDRISSFRVEWGHRSRRRH
jgi:hypothetical protein